MRPEFESWETHAQWWQDGFTAGADLEYEQQMVPLACAAFAAGTRVLDVGCGEGQLARVMAEAQVDVVGLDPSAAQLATAAQRAGGPCFVRGELAALPFPAECFDGVFGCLVFEHVLELSPAIAEVARVLRPGGRCFFILNHPLLQAPDSGWIDDHILAEQYWRIGPYLPEDIRNEKLDDGVVLPFVHRPISRYLQELFAHGFVVDGFAEPPPVAAFLAEQPQYAAQEAFPRVMVVSARRSD